MEKKKILIYIILIIIVLLLGIFVAKELFTESTTVMSNKVEAVNQINNSIINNSINNIVDNEIDENNVIENTTENSVSETESNTVSNNSTNKNSSKNKEEIALNMAKEKWGNDNSVSFRNSGTDENGRYIVKVIDAETTNVVVWYYIDVDNNKIETKYM